MKNRINLDLEKPEEAAVVFKALSSPERLQILQALTEKVGMNISDLAQRFKLPLSTAALHVKVLEEAGLIFVQEKPGLRGAQKACAVQVGDVYFNIWRQDKAESVVREVVCNMPLGNYFDCSVTTPCGIAGKRSFIGIADSTNAFYSPNRVHAQLLWFASGFLEYRFPYHAPSSGRLSELNFSFEVCSEAAGYNNDWPSDITVWINHEEVCTFRCAGDFGGKRGLNNPKWWPENATQYGELRSLSISGNGCFCDSRKTSDLNIDALKLTQGEYISFKIGVKEDSEFVGGINIFGEYFGNYSQNIRMTTKFL
jgi:predicted transcriptional regulator